MIHNGFKKRIPQQNLRPRESNHFTPHIIMKALKRKFKELWHENISSSSKLEFYKLVKSEFGKEMYLDTVQNYKNRTSLTQLRVSAHRLEIELGRRNSIPRKDRICKWCHRNGITIREIEDESHFLNTCSSNDVYRKYLTIKANSLLSDHYPITQQHLQLHIIQLTNFYSQILNSVSPEKQAHLCRTTARYIRNAFANREKFIDSLKAA